VALSAAGPGTTGRVFLLTVITVLCAAFADDGRLDPVLRPMFFALLLGFFVTIGRRERRLAGQPFRLIVAGYLVLLLASATSAVIRSLEWHWQDPFAVWILRCCEHGAVLLLGNSLLAYGILLWIPQVLESRRMLRAGYARARGQLRTSELARTRIEQRLVEADRLHTMGQLAAGVAHDLRNPLAIVKAAAEAMQRRVQGQAELLEHATVICRNVDRAERTIKSLLDLGKPSAAELQAIAVDRLLADALELVAVEARRRGVALHRDVEPGLQLRSEPRLLQQVLLNLLLNALEAGGTSPTITLRARAVRLADAAMVAIAVEDRGKGIDPATRARLFAPFFTTKAGGTGLGLLSSRRIVSELHGRLGLFARAGGGARALLLLPQDGVPPRAAETPSGLRRRELAAVPS
jgi:signal transduction histidine kinase